MYHTHHNSAEQEGKWLYGIFIVDPKLPTVQFDREVIQVLAEMDGYFLINGKASQLTTNAERITVRADEVGIERIELDSDRDMGK
jgi:hypothetical protein